jgi:hypothetical protein
MGDESDPIVQVRRQWNDYRIASYRLSQIGGAALEPIQRRRQRSRSAPVCPRLRFMHRNGRWRTRPLLRSRSSASRDTRLHDEEGKRGCVEEGAGAARSRHRR